MKQRIEAMLGTARPGRDGRGKARRGGARYGLARRCSATRGTAKPGRAWQSKAFLFTLYFWSPTVAKKKTTAHQSRPDQGHFEGMAPEKNNKVDAAARRYAKLRDARMEAGREEKDAHDTLLGTMSEEGVESYDFKDLHVAIDKKQKAKVSIGAAAAAEPEADDAE